MIAYFSEKLRYNNSMAKKTIITKKSDEEFSNKKFDLLIYLKNKFSGKKKFKANRMSIITRKFITFCIYIIIIVALFLYGFLSPERTTYTSDQLATEREFSNNTGEIVMTSQTYSEENGIVLLEFETSDYTSSIDKGINASNLTWELRTMSNNENMTMEVIPLTNNKIDVIIKNVPENYNLLSIRITNNTASADDVDVSIQDYDDYLSSSSESKDTEDDDEDSNSTYFLVTPQSELFKEKYIKNLSREKFALQIFNDELKFQKSQVKKLETAIEKLQDSVKEDEKSISELQTEAQYLVGNQLTEKQDDIEDLQDEINSKNKDIATANDNITTVNATITQLEKNIQAVKDGTYQFASPITSVTMKEDEVGE